MDEHDEYINDLYIDVTLLMPRETISLKSEFIKRKLCIELMRIRV